MTHGRTTQNGSIVFEKQGRYGPSLHNENGPAVIYPSGEKAFFIDGIKHRADGPAVIKKDEVEWWYNGKRVNFKQLCKEANISAEKAQDILDNLDHERMMLKLEYGK